MESSPKFSEAAFMMSVSKSVITRVCNVAIRNFFSSRKSTWKTLSMMLLAYFREVRVQKVTQLVAADDGHQLAY